MSYEVTDDELRKFMESNPKYAKYRDNLALARILYAKHVGALVSGMPQVNSDKLHMFKGMRVKLRGIIASYTLQEYDACPKCMKAKRKCVCGEPNVVKRYVIVYTLGDNFGNVEAVSWSEAVDEKSLDSLIGSEVEVIGRVEEDEDGFKLMSVTIQPISGQDKASGSGEALRELMNLLAIAKQMKIELFENLAREKGVDLAEAMRMVEVSNGYVYPKRA